jgi:hypothetical protein
LKIDLELLKSSEDGQFTLNLRVINHSSVRIDLVLFDLAPDYSVVQIVPRRKGASLTLDPQESKDLRLWGSLPPDLVGRDVLKTFAAEGALDLRWMELPPLARAVPRLGSDYDRDAAPHKAGVTPSTQNQAGLESGLLPPRFPEKEWITAQVEIRVRRSRL